MTTALDRARAWFVAPADEPPFADPASEQANPGASPASPSPNPTAALAAQSASPDPASAAVLGRAGEAEPVAASVALALSQRARARAAIVAVLADAPAGPVAPGTGGTRAARRLAARLEAHGLPPRPRGRLVWVGLAADDARAAVARLAAMGAPLVLAVIAPRTPVLDEMLAEQDLILVVTADPDGPLARLALAAHPTTPVLAAPPLGRGPARSLARGGVRPARSTRALLATAGGPA
jgi:CTP:molybdopterin cytidylyltransferase MocA